MKLMLLCVILLCQCKSSKNIDSLNTDSTTFFSISTTSCRGECPVFAFNVDKEGIASYEGTENVSNIGKFSAKLSDTQLKELSALLSAIGYSKMKIKNDFTMVDLPTTYFEASDESGNTKVTYYYPKNEELEKLKTHALALIESLNWQKDS